MLDARLEPFEDPGAPAPLPRWTSEACVIHCVKAEPSTPYRMAVGPKAYFVRLGGEMSYNLGQVELSQQVMRRQPLTRQ
jgi:hypothetical protein